MPRAYIESERTSPPGGRRFDRRTLLIVAAAAGAASIYPKIIGGRDESVISIPLKDAPSGEALHAVLQMQRIMGAVDPDLIVTLGKRQKSSNPLKNSLDGLTYMLRIQKLVDQDLGRAEGFLNSAANIAKSQGLHGLTLDVLQTQLDRNQPDTRHIKDEHSQRRFDGTKALGIIVGNGDETLRWENYYRSGFVPTVLLLDQPKP